MDATRSAVTVSKFQTLTQRFLLTYDLQDVVSAFESLTRILGLSKGLPA